MNIKDLFCWGYLWWESEMEWKITWYSVPSERSIQISLPHSSCHWFSKYGSSMSLTLHNLYINVDSISNDLLFKKNPTKLFTTQHSASWKKIFSIYSSINSIWEGTPFWGKLSLKDWKLCGAWLRIGLCPVSCLSLMTSHELLCSPLEYLKFFRAWDHVI